MDRRDFIGLSLGVSAVLAAKSKLFAMPALSTFDMIAEKAANNQWEKLPLGDIIGNVAYSLLGKSYVGGVLDESLTETCTINLDKLDCVTLFELSLDIARLIKKNDLSYDLLINEVTLTRYRKGIIDGYTSRLHYTADWIYDNVKKGVINDITKELGGKKIRFNLNFMSQNPKYYKQLINSSVLIPEIEKYEKDINQRDYYYILNKEITGIEDKLQTGDIIAIVTNKQGLDYSHTGLIYKNDKIAHFLHASSKKKKVVLDVAISEYAKQVSSNIGITVLRPLEPANG